MSRLHANTFGAIAAIGCLVIAAGAFCLCTSPGHSGNAAVQGTVNNEASFNLAAPACAVGTSTFTLVAIFVVAAVIYPAEFAGRGCRTVFATEIRPPPIA